MKIFFAVCFLAVANRAFGASDDGQTATRHGVITPQGQDPDTLGQVIGSHSVTHHQSQPVIQYQPPSIPYRDYPVLPMVDPNRYPRTPTNSFIDTYIKYMIYMELLKLIRPTTTVAATVSPTTVDPCTSWKEVDSCRYYVFYGKMSWNDAKEACTQKCSSKLASESSELQMDGATTRSTFEEIMALFPGVPAGSNVWIGASDADSSHTVLNPMWLDMTPITTDLTSYDINAGIASCGYYAPASSPSTGIRYNVCSTTSAATPSYYLCEFCP